MKRFLSAFLLTLSLAAQAGLPPTTLSGQSQTVKPTTFSFKTPYNQSTKISGTESLIETGNANVLADPGAEATTTPWSAYNDGIVTAPCLGTCPVDGTGGSPNVTVSNSTSSPLRGLRSLVLVKDAVNRQGQGISQDFTIDVADQGKVLQGSFDYQIASGTFVDDAMTVWIYDITNSRLIQPAPTKLKNSGIIERFPFEFQTSIDSTSYRLIVHQSSTSAVASTIKFDNFKVGPSAKLYGSASTTPVTATYTLTNFGNATVTGTVSREGVYANFKGRITIGSTLPSGNLTLNLPSGYSLTGNDFKHGAVTAYKAIATATFYTGQPYAQSTTTIGFAGGSSAGVWTGNITPAVFVAGDYIEFDFRAQIAGWSSSQIMSSDADTRVVAADSNFKLATGTLNGSYNLLKIPAGLVDTHAAYNATTGEYTIPTPGLYEINVYVESSFGSASDSAGVSVGIYKNGSAMGLYGNNYIARNIAGNITAVKNGLLNLVANDKISFYSQSGAVTPTFTNSATGSGFSIKRLSGPAQIAASESVSAKYTTSSGQVVSANVSTALLFNTKEYDSHGAYNTTTGEFTAPMSGKYRFTVTGLLNSVSQDVGRGVLIYIAGKEVGRRVSQNTTSIIRPFSGESTVNMVAGQKELVQILYENTSGTAQVVPLVNLNYIQIERVGNY